MMSRSDAGMMSMDNSGGHLATHAIEQLTQLFASDQATLNGNGATSSSPASYHHNNHLNHHHQTHNQQQQQMDEDEDTLLCGRCKQTFNSIQVFVHHKAKCCGGRTPVKSHQQQNGHDQSRQVSNGGLSTLAPVSLPLISVTSAASNSNVPIHNENAMMNPFDVSNERDTNRELNGLLSDHDLVSLVPSIDPGMVSISPSVLNMTGDNSLGIDISITSPTNLFTSPTSDLFMHSTSTSTKDATHGTASASTPRNASEENLCNRQKDINHQSKTPAEKDKPDDAPKTPITTSPSTAVTQHQQVVYSLPCSTLTTPQATITPVINAGGQQPATINLCTTPENGLQSSIPLQTTFNIPIQLIASNINGSQILLTPTLQPGHVQLGGANIVLNISSPLNSLPLSNFSSGVTITRGLNDTKPVHVKKAKEKEVKRPVAKTDAGINVLPHSEFQVEATKVPKPMPKIKEELFDPEYNDGDTFQNPSVSSSEAHRKLSNGDLGEGGFNPLKMPLVTSAPATSSLRLQKRLKCHFCDRSFNKNFDLQQHIRCHTGEKPFQCVVCGRAFAQKSNVKKHMQTHKVWPDGLSNTIPGPTPSASASSGAEDGNGETVTTDDQHQAQPATQTSQTDQNVMNGTDEGAMQSNNNDAPPPTAGTQNNNNSYACPYCEYVGKTYFELKSHMKQHKREKVYKCIQSSCGQMFPDLEPYIEHIESHKNEMTYRCHQCSKTFPTLQDLGEHQFIHSLYPNQAPRSMQQKFYRCAKCLNKYTTPSALEHHQATSTHHYPCTQCNKIFPCERYLRRHLVTHGAGLHCCQYCGKTFKTANYLKVHVVIHTGDKPYSCNVCQASFNRRDKLKRHKLVHDPIKRFKCPFKIHTGCNKEFNRPDKLKSHMLTHSGVKPYGCSVCSRAFSRKAHLRDHIKQHAAAGSLTGIRSLSPRHSGANGDLVVSTSHPSSLAHTASSENLAGNKITYVDCSKCGTLFAGRNELERHSCSTHTTTSPYRMSLGNGNLHHRSHHRLGIHKARPKLSRPFSSAGHHHHQITKHAIRVLNNSDSVRRSLTGRLGTSPENNTKQQQLTNDRLVTSTHTRNGNVIHTLQRGPGPANTSSGSAPPAGGASNHQENLTQVDIVDSGDSYHNNHLEPLHPPHQQQQVVCSMDGYTYTITTCPDPRPSGSGQNGIDFGNLPDNVSVSGPSNTTTHLINIDHPTTSQASTSVTQPK